MIHPLSPMVIQMALTLMNSGNPIYQHRSLHDVISEVLQNIESVGEYFSEEVVDGTVH